MKQGRKGINLFLSAWNSIFLSTSGHPQVKCGTLSPFSGCSVVQQDDGTHGGAAQSHLSWLRLLWECSCSITGPNICKPSHSEQLRQRVSSNSSGVTSRIQTTPFTLLPGLLWCNVLGMEGMNWIFDCTILTVLLLDCACLAVVPIFRKISERLFWKGLEWSQNE